MSPQKKYWFPAKRYGWGWGFPSTWQGWVVFAVLMALVWLGSVLFPPLERPTFYVGYVAVLCAAFIAVAWRKGEPPRWRWGGD
jgi:hypothetical protein